MYQQTHLSDLSVVGAPGPLPYVIAAWDGALDLLADLTGEAPHEFGFDGTGFWPVIVSPAAFDATKQTLAGGIADLAVDAPNKRWTATQAVRDLTAAELAAALATAQQAQIATLSAACGAQILAGYTSSALGAPHSYPAQVTDQLNMIASVTKASLPSTPADATFGFVCADATGVWAMRSHTVAQITQAGSDGFAAIATARQKFSALQAQVMAATTVSGVEAITW